MDSPTALQEFLEFILAQLVEKPKQAKLGHEFVGGRHVYRVELAESDVANVIGRNGYTVSAIRSLLTAAARRNNLKVKLKIYQNDGTLVS